MEETPYINIQIRDKNLVRIKSRSIQTGESNALIARDYGTNASVEDSVAQISGSVNTSDEDLRRPIATDSAYMSAFESNDNET